MLAWRLSNTLDTHFCIEALEAALRVSQSEIFNTDQGTQFTSLGFTGILEGRNIRISRDGLGVAATASPGSPRLASKVSENYLIPG